MDEHSAILALGTDLKRVWSAPTTTARDRKELLRSLLEEVIISVCPEQYRAHLSLRWHGELLTEIDVDLPRSRPATVRTDEKTLALVRRQAAHYSDSVIAGILNRQERTTARGLRFSANNVGNLRRHLNIARFEPPTDLPTDAELVNITQAAKNLGISRSRKSENGSSTKCSGYEAGIVASDTEITRATSVLRNVARPTSAPLSSKQFGMGRGSLHSKFSIQTKNIVCSQDALAAIVGSGGGIQYKYCTLDAIHISSPVVSRCK